MKAQELRIGNYIMSGNNGIFQQDGIIGKVLEIGSDEREFEQIYCDCEESFEWFFKDNYFGIPLTEEWLEKFGFEHDSEAWFNNIALYKCYDGFNYNVNFYEYDNLHIIKYVHQLQNLYFSLTGEELTF